MGRTNDTLRVRSEFYIITNGEKTEYNYFSLLRAKKSIYDVKVKFSNGDPLGLVQSAERYVTKSNQVWVVFDVDNSYEEGRLILAIQEAEKMGVKYAFSNKAFEVWLVSHFGKCERAYDVEGLYGLLNHYLAEKKRGLQYEKNNKEILKNFFIPQYREACESAKIVYQKWNKEHLKEHGPVSRPEIWKWNSCTTVFQLIEALKLQIKK